MSESRFSVRYFNYLFRREVGRALIDEEKQDETAAIQGFAIELHDLPPPIKLWRIMDGFSTAVTWLSLASLLLLSFFPNLATALMMSSPVVFTGPYDLT